MTEPVQVRVGSAAELFAALSAPDPMARCAALVAVLEHPDVTVRYGSHAGRDVVDVLLAMHEEAGGDVELRLVLAALASFDDPRVVARMRAVFAQGHPEDILLLALRRLQGLDPAERHAFFRGWLTQDARPTHARLAAVALRDIPYLSVAEQVRLAVVAPDASQEPPPVNGDSRQAWLHELAAQFTQGARAQLQRMGQPAWQALVGGRGITDETRLWLLEWGVGAYPDEVIAPLSEALQHPSTALARDALRLVPRLGAERSAVLREALVPFARSNHADVRLDAMRAGVAMQNWGVLAQQDPDPRVRAVALHWLAREEGARAVDALAQCLAHDDDWRVRAAAADALVAIGEAAVPVVEPLVGDDRPAIRAAAFRVLLMLGREDWLEEHVLW